MLLPQLTATYAEALVCNGSGNSWHDITRCCYLVHVATLCRAWDKLEQKQGGNTARVAQPEPRDGWQWLLRGALAEHNLAQHQLLLGSQLAQ